MATDAQTKAARTLKAESMKYAVPDNSVPHYDAGTEKARKIVRLLEEMGCNARYYKLIELITGETLVKPKPYRGANVKIAVYENMVVVPIANSNGHNYTMQEPCLLIEPRTRLEAVRMDGTTGNMLPLVRERTGNYCSDVRAACVSEVEDFYNTLLADAPEYFDTVIYPEGEVGDEVAAEDLF